MAYINFYNFERPHSSLSYRTPAEIYYGRIQNKSADSKLIMANKIRT